MRDQLVMDQPIEQKWKPFENILRALLYSMMPRSTFDNLVWLFFLNNFYCAWVLLPLNSVLVSEGYLTLDHQW